MTELLKMGLLIRQMKREIEGEFPSPDSRLKALEELIKKQQKEQDATPVQKSEAGGKG